MQGKKRKKRWMRDDLERQEKDFFFSIFKVKNTKSLDHQSAVHQGDECVSKVIVFHCKDQD